MMYPSWSPSEVPDMDATVLKGQHCILWQFSIWTNARISLSSKLFANAHFVAFVGTAVPNWEFHIFRTSHMDWSGQGSTQTVIVAGVRLTLGISNSWPLLDIYSWSWYHNWMQVADACQSVVEGAAWGFMNLPESMGLCLFFGSRQHCIHTSTNRDLPICWFYQRVDDLVSNPSFRFLLIPSN